MKKSETTQKIILVIDTSNNKEVVIKLRTEDKEIVMKEEMTRVKTQAVLPLVEKILQKKELKREDLTEIEVVTGPGSFTGLRVGVAIANTLAIVLKIPVNQREIGVLVEPTY